MRTQIRLGNIWGIPIGLHTSWFLVFILITWTLAQGYMPEDFPGLSVAMRWILAGVTSLLFFASVLAHELGHAFFAQRYGIPVHSITLFIFGGVAQIERQPETARSEFVIAIAGPAVSLLLGGIFGGLWFVTQSVAFLAAPLFWLARINVILALFNMIPGFPLDGGRVLRAAVWAFSNNFTLANRVAAASGQIVAFGFLAVGIYNVFNGSVLNGIWLAFIGWFLQNAAAANYQQSNLQEQLRDLKVDQVMTRDRPMISSRLPVSQLVNEKIMRGGPRYYFVQRDGYGFEEGDARPFGMVSVSDVTQVPAEGWPLTPAEQIMTPWENLITTTPQTCLTDAMQVMDESNVAQLPVIQDDQLIGVLSRQQVFRYIRLRSQFSN